MKLTGLKRNTRNDRISVSIDGQFYASVSMDTLLELGIKPDTDLTEYQLARLKEKSLTEKTQADAARILRYGPRTEYELQRRLEEKGHDPSDIRYVLETCKRVGLVDDEAYAQSFVRLHKDMNGWGPDKIRNALREKRLSDPLIETAIRKEYGAQQVLDQALRAVEKKLPVLMRKTEDPRILRQKLMTFLESRGFGRSESAQAVHTILSRMKQQ